MIRLANGQMKPNITRRGWGLLVQFKDEGLEQVKLKYLKVANPVDLAEYAVVNCLTSSGGYHMSLGRGPRSSIR
eukprot:1801231-Ditylum_brightwellii.AAC.1